MGPVLIFDGDCGFCTSSARWIAGQAPALDVVPYRSVPDDTLHGWGISRADAATAVCLVDERGTVHRGHRAIAEALRRGTGPDRAAGRLLLLPPLSWLAAPAYALIARNRHRLPGGTPACKL